jgi:hypothetical protein
VTPVSFVVFGQVVSTRRTERKVVDGIVPGPIVFRGRTYRSVDEMPAKVRRAYEQVLRMLDDMVPSGAPDVWEGWGPGEGPWPGPPDVIPP